MASNASFELEAKQKVEAECLYFAKTPETSLALFELYRDGESDSLPRVTVKQPDLKKSAYWLVEAAKSDHEEALQYLERLIPQYEKHLYQADFVDILAKQLEKQAKVFG
jgi:hypothetical protein